MQRRWAPGRMLVLALLSLLVAACGGGNGTQPTATSPAQSVTPGDATPLSQDGPRPTAEPSAAATPSPPEPTATVAAPALGGARPAVVLLPPGYQPGAPAPLLLLLHGYGSNPAENESFLPLVPAAARAGMLYVAPEGTRDSRGDRFWNATPACCDMTGQGVDDSAYLRDLIEQIQAHYSVDPRRIYVVGASNGGFMAHRLACDHADLIAAIVSLAGAGALDPAACQPAEPAAVLQIHGDADSVIAYKGGSFAGSYPSARQTVEGWAVRNGCATTPRQGPAIDLAAGADFTRPGAAPLPGAETSVDIYDSGCRPGGHVELWTIARGDHVPALVPDAAQRLVDFLLAHPKA